MCHNSFLSISTMSTFSVDLYNLLHLLVLSVEIDFDIAWLKDCHVENDRFGFEDKGIGWDGREAWVFSYNAVGMEDDSMAGWIDCARRRRRGYGHANVDLKSG